VLVFKLSVIVADIWSKQCRATYTLQEKRNRGKPKKSWTDGVHYVQQYQKPEYSTKTSASVCKCALPWVINLKICRRMILRPSKICLVWSLIFCMVPDITFKFKVEKCRRSTSVALRHFEIYSQNNVERTPRTSDILVLFWRFAGIWWGHFSWQIVPFRAAATGNARSLTVNSRVSGTCNAEVDDHSGTVCCFVIALV